jgi:acetate kinase
MRVLVVNAGSSSLKVRLLEGEDLIGSYEQIPTEIAPAVEAVGHRIVHGGTRFTGPVVIDDVVEQQLHALAELAPLHQSKSLQALAAAREAFPDVTHVACFDTAFHARMPAKARTVALPRAWRDKYALRRYGFHGLSHAWAARRAVQLAPTARRIVTCHLGAGASLCAVLDGCSVETTMSFTPLDGLVMATRSGSVDPGLLLWLQERENLTAGELTDALEQHSGLAGLADESDMRALLARTDREARLAVEVYVHRLAAGVAAMTAALSGLDALVFTGGVGENAAAVRAEVGGYLGHLGVDIDQDRNRNARPDARISADGARVPVFVIAAREDLEIAGLCTTLLQPR